MRTVQKALSVLLIVSVYEAYCPYVVEKNPEIPRGTNVVTVYNDSGQSFYIAFVRTATFSNNKKLYTEKSNSGRKALVRIVSSGGPSALSTLPPHRYVTFQNFDPSLKYNRVLLVSREKHELDDALDRGILDTTDVFIQEVGSKKKVVIETLYATPNGDSKVSFSFSKSIKNSAASFHKPALVAWNVKE